MIETKTQYKTVSGACLFPFLLLQIEQNLVYDHWYLDILRRFIFDNVLIISIVDYSLDL